VSSRPTVRGASGSRLLGPVSGSTLCARPPGTEVPGDEEPTPTSREEDAMETRIGFDEARRSAHAPTQRDLAQALAHVMADTYVLYFQTQSFHWNVRGPSFHSLHEMFEEQYEELAEAVDEL